MTDFTRLTVIGTARKAELVVPDDESVGTLIPQLMDLLGEPTGSVARPLALVRSTGEQLDAALSAAEQRVADGEQLRLVRADDAPPPPEVADVTDAVGDSFDGRRGRWSTVARESTGAVVLGGLACVAGLVTPQRGLGLTAAILLVVLAAAAVFGRWGRRWPALALTALAAGAALPATMTLVHTATQATAWPVVTPITAASVWLVLGVGVGVGLGRRAVLPASGLGIGFALLPAVLAALGVTGDRAVALIVVAAAVAIGLLPWYAMASSGLTGLDDQVVAGRLGRRQQVLRTVDDAYRALSWCVFAVAVPMAAGAALLVLSGDRWSLRLGLVVSLLAALRTRAFPLVVQQLPLWLGAASTAVLAIVSRQGELGSVRVGALLAAVAVVVALLVGLRPARHVRARLRRWGNLAEALCVIALVPLLLGVFGIYADLLRAFG